jgi:predicted  nucleic acid-binding Zn-ribbon protein
MLLIDLQQVDSKLFEHISRSKAIPKLIEGLEIEKEKLDEGLKRAKESLEEARKERTLKEGELEAAESKLSGVRKSLYEIKTNKEYAAAQKEIAFLKTRSAEIEEDVLRLMEEAEIMAESCKQDALRVREDKDKLDREIAEFRSELSEVEDQIAIKKDEKLRLSKRISPGFLSRYDRILSSKGDSAIAFVKADCCEGCFARIPPQRVVEIRRNDSLIECEGCGRILIWKE